MKKKMAILLAAVMFTGLFTGCGASEENQNKEIEAAGTTEDNGTESDAYSISIESIQEKGTLVVCTDSAYPPYSFIDTNSTSMDPVGIDVELAKAVADKLEVELVLQPTVFKDSVASITTGTCDVAINGMTVTDERKESLDFSEPYIECEDGIIIRKEDADKYKTLDDFTGTKISANNGSPQALKVESLLNGAELLGVDNIPTSILEIKAGNVDGIAVEKRVGQQYVMAYDELCFADVTLSNEGEIQSTKAVGFNKNADPELIALVNEVIAECKESGQMDKWLEEYSEIAAKMITGTNE